MRAERVVLCLNGGSSSLKLALFRVGQAEQRLASGSVQGIGKREGKLLLRDEHGTEHEQSADLREPAAAVHTLFEALSQHGLPEPEAVGHRLVHGGPDHSAPERVDSALLATLRDLTPYAPLHLPSELSLIDAVAERSPALPQVVCFDTAFHRDLPALSRRLPLPRALYDAGVRRYGFHGLSYEYIVQALGAAAAGRVVIAHLGSGASMAAVSGGKPLDTTMGMTPTGGLMMATRSGDLDPGVLLHLLRSRGYSADALEQLLERESGLRGVSAGSADMQELLAHCASDPRAEQAVALFCYRIKQQLGAYSATLGGLDTLVFTGGIGEHAAEVRRRACEGLGHLGIELDPARNEQGTAVISRPGAACTVRVLKTDEERMIARHTADCVESAQT